MMPFSDPSDPRPPLPEWVQQAYQILVDAADGSHGELSYEAAYAALEEADAFSAEHSDSEYAVERLLKRGYLYEANGALRITDPLEDGDDE
ncbi:hypothetical protein [Halarchaeum sp. P4]|uniref:hypothetical protein n=1 Tax=Halarchaeum sp. P4 TaxID=3421639 RepID=UPI003EC0E68C